MNDEQAYDTKSAERRNEFWRASFLIALPAFSEMLSFPDPHYQTTVDAAEVLANLALACAIKAGRV
jgi:hypothetical protein